MEKFYDNLLNGMSKTQALQSAKRSYLQEADPVHTNPIYWAGFVLVGDWQPVTIQRNSGRAFVVSLFVLAIMGLAVYGMHKSKD
jgi:hypothetical protein